MSNKDKEIIAGVVTERLPDARYRVTLENGKEIIAYTSGKMRLNTIKIIIGDSVTVELDPYGGVATNRIVRRK